MKARIAELVNRLRRDGLRVSVAEAMDAARAAATVGVERPVLRDALAAALVKDERDRPLFLAAFDAVFPSRRPARTRRTTDRGRSAAGSGGSGSVAGRAAGSSERSPASPAADPAASASSPPRPAASGRLGAPTGAPTGDATREAPTARDADDAPGGEGPSERDRDAWRSARERDVPSEPRAPHGIEREGPSPAVGAIGLAADRARALPFRAMTPADVEAAAALVRALAVRVQARFRRRLAPRATGRLDFRRTIRAAVSRGGVPFERRFRGRRPGRSDLVALVDLSASAATATGFFLALLAPAAAYFRRVRLFGYVDRLVEIEFVAGQVRPAGPLDLMARSDFGRVLRDLTESEASVLGADTILLVLGDARNNRRPPRADLLAAARARVRRVLWLNPEPRERWNTGDSVIAAYARHADAVVPCGTLADLERALAAVARL